jgi:hypothetical protein
MLNKHIGVCIQQRIVQKVNAPDSFYNILGILMGNLDNHCKFSAMQYTTADQEAVSESKSFVTSTLSIEDWVISNGGRDKALLLVPVI